MRRKYKLKTRVELVLHVQGPAHIAAKPIYGFVMFSFVQDQQRPVIQTGLGIRGRWFAYKSKECRIRCATNKQTKKKDGKERDVCEEENREGRPKCSRI